MYLALQSDLKSESTLESNLGVSESGNHGKVKEQKHRVARIVKWRRNRPCRAATWYLHESPGYWEGLKAGAEGFVGLPLPSSSAAAKTHPPAAMAKYNVVQKNKREFNQDRKRQAHGDPNSGKLKHRNAPVSMSGKRKRKLLRRHNRVGRSISFPLVVIFLMEISFPLIVVFRMDFLCLSCGTWFWRCRTRRRL